MAGRMSRDMYFFLMAVNAARRSSCERRKVGAVVVDRHNMVVSTGYAGAPAELRHCIDGGCVLHEGRCVNTVHAEQNALVRSMCRGRTMYCTDKPCCECLKLALAAGIQRVMYIRDYPDARRDAFVHAHNLHIPGRVQAVTGWRPPWDGSFLQHVSDNDCKATAEELAELEAYIAILGGVAK